MIWFSAQDTGSLGRRVPFFVPIWTPPGRGDNARSEHWLRPYPLLARPWRGTAAKPLVAKNSAQLASVCALAHRGLRGMHVAKGWRPRRR